MKNKIITLNPDSNSILAGWLIDGTGRHAQKNMLLQVKNSCIKSVKKADNDDIKNAETDLSDCTIMPFLIDSHVHLCMSGTEDQKVRQHQLNAGFDDMKNVIADHINKHIFYGIAAIRDGGDHYGHTLRYKNEFLESEQKLIYIKAAGKGWHQSGRYGRLIGRAPDENETLGSAIKKHKQNTDHVKIVNSGLNSLKNFGKQTPPQFSLEQMKEAVEAGNSLNLKVMVHANGEIPVKISVEAGCHSIEHGFFMGKENLKLMADKQITWVPTACPMNAYLEYMKKTGMDYEITQENLDHQLEQIFWAKEFGVPVALGTDSGSIGVHHGKAVFEEMKLLIKAGFSLPEAVKCASFNGANLLDIKNIGRLIPGMQARFIAVKCDPVKLPVFLF
ncbi:Amidohydrolase-related domain-containing protein [Candidatus Magnetomoraceae bacterium gMMP-15]